MTDGAVRSCRGRRLATHLAVAGVISHARRGRPDVARWPNKAGMRGAAARLQRLRKPTRDTTLCGTPTCGFHLVCYAALNRRVNPKTVTRRSSLNRRSSA